VTFCYIWLYKKLCVILTCGPMSPKWECKSVLLRILTSMRATNYQKLTNLRFWLLKILRSFFTEISPNSAANNLGVRQNSNSCTSVRRITTPCIGTVAPFATVLFQAAIFSISTSQKIMIHFFLFSQRKRRRTSASFQPAYIFLGHQKKDGTTQLNNTNSRTTLGSTMREKRVERNLASWRNLKRNA